MCNLKLPRLRVTVEQQITPRKQDCGCRRCAAVMACWREQEKDSGRKTMSKAISCMTLCCLILFACVAGAQQQQASPKVEVPILPKSRAMSPAPPADARHKAQKNTIGEGRVAVTTSEPSSYWEEHDAMGQMIQGVVTTAFLYDQKAGILYAYRNGDFACNNSNMSGNVLEAVYAQGNPAGQPVGSGWYIAELNAGQCGAKADGVFGCKFNAEGQHTACGIATKNPQTGEVDFAEVSESK
jgi:hypothetical protein